MAHARGPRDRVLGSIAMPASSTARKGVAGMMQFRSWRVPGVLAIVIVITPLAARGNNAANLFVQSTGQTVTSVPVVGSTAPPFHLTTIDGQQYSSASLRGKTVILFAMFASCADCIPQGQTLSRIQHAYAGKGVIILGVDMVAQESVDALRQYQRVGHIT